MLAKLRSQYSEFPQTFRVLVAATFIDRLGGALIFPFLSLYVAQKFDVGMTQVGLLFGIWSVSGSIGSMIGGALADKFGRKTILILGLLFSAGSAIFMGFIEDMRAFYLLAAVSGIFSDMGHPAQQAMVADLLQGEQRAEGFSLIRIVANLAITFGPMIGGLLAGVSYLLLFIIDAIASLITAMIVFKKIPETKPADYESQRTESFLETVAGYGRVLKDKLFVAFIISTILIVTVYTQMNSTLSVYLNRVHGVSAQGFGAMMSMNAAMVVIFQFGIARKIKPYPPMLMMILASALYGIGFSMFAFVHARVYFFIAMAIITIGEMVHVPVAQTLTASFAPEDMRGRYMAAYGLSWAIPNSVASLLAGLVMDNYEPEWVWILAGILSLVAVSAFAFLFIKTRRRFETVSVENGDGISWRNAQSDGRN